MKIQIKNRLDSSIIFECEADSIRTAVELAVKAQVNLSFADLSFANLSGANLSFANLYMANLFWAKLSGSNLSWADLSFADLSFANLSGANLSFANLSGVNLYRAKLSGAKLFGTDLSGARFYFTDLSGAELFGAKLFGEKLNTEPIQILNLKYFILITKQEIKIGCELHKAEQWFSFDDETISKMDIGALKWWKVYKPIIKALWEEHCK